MVWWTGRQLNRRLAHVRKLSVGAAVRMRRELLRVVVGCCVCCLGAAWLDMRQTTRLSFDLRKWVAAAPLHSGTALLQRVLYQCVFSSSYLIQRACFAVACAREQASALGRPESSVALLDALLAADLEAWRPGEGSWTYAIVWCCSLVCQTLDLDLTALGCWAQCWVRTNS
jgi:hypothetical protein